MKKTVVGIIVQVVVWAVLLGIGIWYLHSSIGGASMPYVSLPRFLQSIGACENGVCDIASANGCFLCPYVQKLFFVIGKSTEVLWDAIINHTWILMVFGLVVFMFWKAYDVINTSNKENASLGTGGRKLDFQLWFKDVKDLFIRVVLIAALLGAVNLGGRETLQGTANVVVYPVMHVGTSLAMAATGIGESAVCGGENVLQNGPMQSVAQSFLCVIGNLNAVILSGASSGFAMMNFAWMGMGGGLFTWLGGLAVVLLFLYIGFNVMFKVLNVVFNLVFIIVFLPLFLASLAFEKVWKTAGDIFSGGLGILAKTSVRVIGITIEIMILSSLVTFSMEKTMSSDVVAETAIIEKCESVSANANGEIDKNVYVSCFKTERLTHPEAFRYLDNGWDFLIMMIFIWCVYRFLIDQKLQAIIDTSDKGAYFNFGNGLKEIGVQAIKIPGQIAKKFEKKKK